MIMPEGMLKRTSNTTTYQKPTDIIFWKVHCVFIMNDSYNINELFKFELDTSLEVNIHGSLVGITISSISELTTIEQLTSYYFDPSSTNSIQRHTLKSLRLQRANIRCLIQHIPSSSNNPIFNEINLNFSIKDSLKNKTIIEYPTFYFGTILDTMKLYTSITTLSIDMIDNYSETNGTTNSFPSSMKRKIDSLSINENFSPKRTNNIKSNEFVETIIGDQSVENSEQEQDNDDIDEDETPMDTEFMSALLEFEKRDINSLKEFIAKSEAELL